MGINNMESFNKTKLKTIKQGGFLIYRVFEKNLLPFRKLLKESNKEDVHYKKVSKLF